MKKLLFISFYLLAILPLLTAQTFKIEGKILDSRTNYPLPGADVKTDMASTRTDNTGSFVLNHDKGEFIIRVKKDNLEERTFNVKILNDTSLTLLFNKVIKINEVIVSANRQKVFTRDNNLEVAMITPAKISFLPSVGSNEDLLKKIQLLPGIQSSGEGSSGLVVRGGQYDQNLITINGFPIYQFYHFSGFLSAIDPFLVSDVEVMKGGFPARFGGKLSSVINFISDQSISDTSHISVNAGIFISGVAARFSPDKKTSVNLSARFGTTSILERIVHTRIPEFPFYNFYDMNLGVSRIINNKNSLSLTLFLNKDYLSKNTYRTLKTETGDTTALADVAKSGWADILAGIGWTFQPKDNLKIETKISYQFFNSYSNHASLDPVRGQAATNNAESTIKEFGITNQWKADKGNHKLNFGFCSYIKNINPVMTTTVELNGSPIYDVPDPISDEKPISQIEFSPYFEDQFNITKNTTFRPGIRFLTLIGSKKVFILPEPRLYVSHKISDKVSVMGSWVGTTQDIQLISSSNIMSCSDLWIPAGGEIKPAYSNMEEIGFFFNDGMAISSEINVYYKSMKNLYNYKDGASFLFNPRWQDNITMATGKSYGAEFMVQGSLKKMFFMFSYTLSKTTRKSPEVNDGKEFEYKYDRPHNLNITLGYKPSEKFNFSCDWVFQSGILNTFETRVYQRDMRYYYYQYPYIDNINNTRYPYYHRLDLGCEYTKSLKWGKIVLKTDIYNVYSKLNPWYVEAMNAEGFQDIWQVTLFPILPSLSLKVEF